MDSFGAPGHSDMAKDNERKHRPGGEVPRPVIIGGIGIRSAEDLIERSKAVERILGPLAVELWRLEKRLSKLQDLQNSLAGKSALDQMQRIRDMLESAKVEIRDHTGQVYTDGASLKVLSFEESADIPLREMRVLETVKPTILWLGYVIEHGEVIVGVPAKEQEQPHG